MSEVTPVPQQSYSDGASPVPLMGETIGDNLRRIAVTYAASEALVDVPTGRRWTYAQLARRHRHRRSRAARPRHRQG